jgi:hypothetical protein
MTNTLSPEARTAVVTALRENHERVIRDMAGTVLSLVRSRREHPSYGTTKTMIRDARQRMEGSIGTYMVLFGQASHVGVPLLATFWESEETSIIVTRARREVDAL